MLDLSRRDFARLLALTGSAALFPDRLLAESSSPLRALGLSNAALPPTPAEPDEAFWRQVRSRFLLSPDLGFINAANLCPTSLPAIEAMERNTRAYDASPSPETRTTLTKSKEEARRLLAESLRVTPEEIVITRNTSEGNNLVSSGLQLGPTDEVLVFSDNHPSNLNAWREKGRRFGFKVVVVPQVNPHPGTEYYVDEFKKAITPRTKRRRTHAREQQLRRRLSGGRAVRARARKRSALARRRRAIVRRARRRPERDQTGLLYRLGAQVAVRSEGDGRALRHARRPRPDLAQRHQPVCGHDRDLAEARGERPARRRGARRVCGHAEVQQSDRSSGDREAIAPAGAAPDHRARGGSTA